MSLPPIPKRVRLFGQTITVEWAEGLKDDAGREAAGLAHIAECRIELDKCLRKAAPSFCWQVFLHECVHFMFELQGCMELSADERLVDTTSQLIFQLMFPR